MRRLGTGAWIDIGGRLSGDTLEARIDDVALPDGTYDVRARVRDVAGNERTVHPPRGRIADAARPAVASGHGDRVERTQVPVQAPALPVRQRIRNGMRVHARLTANGGPVGRTAVTVFSRPRTGGPFAPLATLRTDADGRIVAS